MYHKFPEEIVNEFISSEISAQGQCHRAKVVIILLFLRD